MKTPFGKQASGLRLERMQASARYRDGEFRNLHPLPLLMPHLGEAAEPTRTGAPTPWWRTPGVATDTARSRLASEAEPALAPNAPLAWPLD